MLLTVSLLITFIKSIKVKGDVYKRQELMLPGIDAHCDRLRWVQYDVLSERDERRLATPFIISWMYAAALPSDVTADMRVGVVSIYAIIFSSAHVHADFLVLESSRTHLCNTWITSLTFYLLPTLHNTSLTY